MLFSRLYTGVTAQINPPLNYTSGYILDYTRV